MKQLAVGKQEAIPGTLHELSKGTCLCCWGHGSGPLAFVVGEGDVGDITRCPGCSLVKPVKVP